MDLKEKIFKGTRHPWEIARIALLRQLLGEFLPAGTSPRVLDIGCGDGFVLQHIFRPQDVAVAHGLDIHLPPSETGPAPDGTTCFFNDPKLIKERYDLLLLCDVIEHVEDDRSFLCQAAETWAANGALCVITVPFGQALMSSHDAALGHYRRYSFRSLEGVLSGTGFEVLGRGSMFLSLLLVRALTCLKEKLFGVGEKPWSGLGAWRAPSMITSCVVFFLSLDNMILWVAGRRGLRLPGLSLWAVARWRGK